MKPIDYIAVQRVLDGTGHYLALTDEEQEAFLYELARRQTPGRTPTLLVDFKPTPAPGEAPCAGDVRYTQYPTDTSLVAACQTCDLLAWCVDIVQPKAMQFDGICGGVVWSNGRPVAAT